MKIVVTAEGNELNAPTSPRFGRCPTYIFVESETMAFEAVPNPAMSAPGGAGIQAAQFVVERGAEAVLTGNVGPNAANVFQAAGIVLYPHSETTVRAAVEAFRAGRLAPASGPTVEAHAGMGVGRSRAREAEIATLKGMAADLRQQLADVIDRIAKLEQES